MLLSVSIIVPVYNVEPYVEECLRSVAAQTYRGSLECVVVDDRGEDNSAEVCRRFIENYNGAIVFRMVAHEQNRGLGAARNTGVREAQGEYLYFLDSDDTITPDCIASLCETAQRYTPPNRRLPLDIVVGNVREYDPRFWYVDISRRKFPEYSDCKWWIDLHILWDIPGILCSKLIRTALLRDKDLYIADRLRYEDDHWRLMAYSYIRSVAFCKTPTYNYRYRENSIMGQTSPLNRLSACIDLVDDLQSRGRLRWSLGAVYLVFYKLLEIHKIRRLRNSKTDCAHRLVALLRKIAAADKTPIAIKLICRVSVLLTPK